MSWVKDAKGYDALEGSESKDYNCVQYTLAKVQGKPPDASTPANKSGVVDELTKLGYAKVFCEECGCPPKKCANCVVVYRKKGEGNDTVFHVAAFDPKRCDWSGKLRPTKPIVRFKDPGDYLKYFDPDAQADSEFDCYCNLHEAPHISDEDLSGKAMRPKGGPGKAGCLGILAAPAALGVLAARLRRRR